MVYGAFVVTAGVRGKDVSHPAPLEFEAQQIAVTFAALGTYTCGKVTDLPAVEVIETSFTVLPFWIYFTCITRGATSDAGSNDGAMAQLLCELSFNGTVAVRAGTT